MHTGRRGGQVHERKAPAPPKEAVSAQQSASGRRTARARLARRVLVLALLVSLGALAMLGGVRLLKLRQRALYLGSNGGAQLPTVVPAYQFVWRADAPGRWSAEEAYAAEGRAQRASDGAEREPAATLWVARSADAAFVLAQLDQPGAWIAPVLVERVGSGASAVWHGSGGTWPTSQRCSGSAMTPSGTCSESWVHSPTGSPLPEVWDWSAADGTVAVAVGFAQPLLAPPQGGQLAGKMLAIGSAPRAAGGVVVVVGTASAAALDRLAEQLATTG